MENKRIRNDINTGWIWVTVDYEFLHREDGPACEFDNGNKYWFVNGARHREGGPAIEYVDGYKEYYLDGNEYSYSDWLRKTRNKKLEVLLNGE